VDRSRIVALLRELSSLLELHGASKFKVRAFARGARTLEASHEPIEKLIAEGRLVELPGIGVALAKQIEELATTGTSELLGTLRRGLPSGVLELSQISGIGLHALRTLSEELGIASVADLRTAAEEGRLREATGFGPKKEAQILDAIARYEQKEPQLLLADALRLFESLEADFGSLAEVDRIDIAGSVRRSVELSRSLDLVVTTSDPTAALHAIAQRPRVSSVERRSPTRSRLRLPDGTRIGVEACLPATRAVTLVRATGSDAHVKRLAGIASERGFELDTIASDDERELYARLGLHWIPPELREDQGEIEDAEREEAHLVEVQDIRGFVHCHSTWSDGKHSIEEMARAAEARGATFITITDHSKNAHYAGGLDVDRLRRQWDEIDEVQGRVAIRILKGTEADILADGALDWPDAILERLDVVIASIHNRYRQDEDQMTERLLRAMRVPVFKIWGHPLGRLITSRPPIACRVEEVLDALAGSSGAVEINGNPHRLDLEPRWVRVARERGLKFVLSVDAHSIRELDNLRFAVGLGRRAGLRRTDVLNTRAASQFARFVRPGGSPSGRGRAHRSAVP
jgi:DNA polymerase (family 10)